MTFSFSMGLAGLLAATHVPPGLLAQKEGAPAETAVRLATLPTSTQGKATATPDIVVTLKHVAPDGAKCVDPKVVCADAAHWAVELAQASKPGVTETVPIERVAELHTKLERAAAAKAKQRGDVKLSDATLSIRAAPGAPYVHVQTLLATAAKSTIHAIEVAVTPSSGVTEQRLPVPLPVDEKPVLADAETKNVPPSEVRITIRMDAQRQRPVVAMGTFAFPDGDAGGESLREKLKLAADGWKRLETEAPGVIEAESGVPWQTVVAVIDAMHATGLKVQFAAPGAPTKVDSPRDTRK